ncbi:3-methyl-2-oxobutanoate hydroxymethyltransferase [Echinimonas agarilytica]|uniref:3-methyl-2-oxobutanoate hydroxymethyltransferase n=1 Tax=Echinimonas agarilytica TaxID=1215918 RepID=A0AA42B6H0_9GAMM|nr:3-methyl-2-oxobutanoate hydroxymethyltransferase [Echinimonas agarilytica]MCM2678757.1 3-methyl-2-oxobutanoate hydroxymethyltransferase [Echinimonas agarilytica]
MKKVSVASLLKKKEQGEKFATLTAYDASFAKIFDDCGIDLILIGDSLGMVLQGEDSTLPVTVEQMAYHTRCVASTAKRAMVVADMPFMSYATPEQTYQNAAQLMRAGAQMVKMEGGEWLAETISGLVDRGVPVCGHLGLTPQSVNVFGGFKIQGRGDAAARQLINSAMELEKAGVQLLVLECIPAPLAKRVARSLTIPVIGIGAGPDTDGQILVMQDMLGLTAGYVPSFSKNYLETTGNIHKAVALYIQEVEQEIFPSAEQSFDE